jgi:PTS system cellobiose-specific IIA component
MEQEIMQIIVNAGNARSKCIKAMKESVIHHYDVANQLFEQAKTDLVLAHNMQTELIQKEIRGEKVELSLLMVHAQDHLMDALVFKDLAELFITESQSNYELIKQLRSELK